MQGHTKIIDTICDRLEAKEPIFHGLAADFQIFGFDCGAGRASFYAMRYPRPIISNKTTLPVAKKQKKTVPGATYLSISTDGNRKSFSLETDVAIDCIFRLYTYVF